ncbi:MAG: hypothetical protein RMK75_02410 [Aquificaceae bacterium]|nr:hypothetical protein [Aquificaceae bacterium]MDW8423161.1 hypothetical protein [Aquificaceae bacterium]
MFSWDIKGRLYKFALIMTAKLILWLSSSKRRRKAFFYFLRLLLLVYAKLVRSLYTIVLLILSYALSYLLKRSFKRFRRKRV